MGLQDYIQANEHAGTDSNPLLSFFPIVQGNNEQTILHLPPEVLTHFQGHTFKVDTSTADFLALRASIREYGIREPLLIRPHPTQPGLYEIIAGHRRWTAGKLERLGELPCILCPCDNDTATQLMGITNIQRPDWLPSEKARTYLAYLDATRRKYGIKTGRPSVKNNSPTGSANLRSDDEAAKLFGVSGDALRMYIKLNELLPTLLELVDEKRIPVKAGYQLSFLATEDQSLILTVMQENPKKKLTDSKAKELRQAAEDGELNREYILRTLGIQKAEQDERQVNISFASAELLNLKTTRTALNDPSVLEAIEQIIINYAKKHGLPLR